MRSNRIHHFIERHGLVLAPATVFLATLAFLPMRPLLGSEQWGWPYMLVVGLVASTWGVGLAMFASVLAFFLWNFMFITPYYTLHVDRSGDLVHLLAFLVVALAVGLQTGRLRESSEAARLQASRTAALYRLSSHMVLGISPTEMADKVSAEVRRVLDHATTAIWVCLSQDSSMLSPLPGAAPQAVTAYSFEAVKQALEDTNGGDVFTTRDSTFLRLSTTSGYEGFLQIHGYTNLGEDDTLFATSVAHLAAVYLENRHMSEVAMRASAAEEAERLRTALVSSVSHELKTPVASLTASVTDLIGRDAAPTAGELNESLTAMTADLSRLDRSIGNLLDASRLEAQAWKPTPTRFEAGELIGSVSNQLPRELRSRIAFAVPEGIPSIRADFVQVTRALRHLVDNALQYSSGTVTIGADATEVGLVRTWVADDGPGIPQHEQESVFERFYRGSAGRHSKSSTGLGLSLAREIVRANGGRIHIEDVEPTGARLVMTLPAVTVGAVRHPDVSEEAS
ncbi:MAG: sensor histidine kinase [Coriobacteriia bacterium]